MENVQARERTDRGSALGTHGKKSDRGQTHLGIWRLDRFDRRDRNCDRTAPFCNVGSKAKEKGASETICHS